MDLTQANGAIVFILLNIGDKLWLAPHEANGCLSAFVADWGDGEECCAQQSKLYFDRGNKKGEPLTVEELWAMFSSSEFFQRMLQKSIDYKTLTSGTAHH